MVTAVDTSVVLDVLVADERFGERSGVALRAALLRGSVVACDVVWAELVTGFDSPSGGSQHLRDLGLHFEPMTEQGCLVAASAWQRYRSSGGPRDRMVADFLIAGHATASADRLLTRDRGFTRRWFEGLRVDEP